MAIGPMNRTAHDPPDEAQRIGNQIAIHVRHKDWARCHAILHGAEHKLDIIIPANETPLVDLLDMRTANILAEIGIYRRGHLKAVSDEALLAINGFGNKTLAMVRQVQHAVDD